MNPPQRMTSQRITLLGRAASPRRVSPPAAPATLGLAEPAPPRGRPRERSLKGALLRLAIQHASEDARRRQARRSRAEQAVRGERTFVSNLGFSLVEMVGVLAIIALLAAALVPVVMKQMDQAALTKETADLRVMSAALQSSILATKTIPTYTNWAPAVSSFAAMSLASVTNTSRGYARAFLIDPNLQIGGAGLPYTQTTNSCTNAPVSARALIVGTLARALPVASGILSSNAFNDLWNTPKGTKPSTWTTWAGNGQDLVIQRINLAPLFHRVILNNGAVGGTGYFSIDAGGPLAVPPGAAGWNAYYLDGTALGLYDTNVNLMARELVKNDLSHVFEYSVWRDGIQMGASTGPTDFTALATQFMAAPSSPAAKWSATPSGLASLMYTFMNAYTAWAAQTPCFAFKGQNSEQQVPEYTMLQAVLKCFSTADYLDGEDGHQGGE